MAFRRTAAIALGLSLPALLVWAQISIRPRPKRGFAEAAIPSANLRVDTNLVLVPVTVNDELNHPITGLEKGNFQVFDEKVEQAIRSFSTEDEPIALGFVFDTSGSMRSALPAGREAAEQFLKFANPEDEFFLVEFDSAPRLTIPLTSDTGRIGTEILMTKSGGSTAMIDAVYLAIHEIRRSKKTKKAVVLISDGGENNSRYTATEIKNLVRESDVLIYTVAVGGGYSGADEMFGRSLMNQIAEMTGAHMYAAGPYDLPDIAEKIGIELRNRYVLGYSPRDPRRDGRYHRIAVKVNPPRGLPKLRAHWRLGYYAPSD
jgi:Ca-activated chloride channel family protein